MKAFINILLIALALAVGAGGRVCRAASATDGNTPSPASMDPNELETASALATADANTPQRLSGDGPGFFVAESNLAVGRRDVGASELFYRTMFAVMLVIVLGAAAMYVSKRCLPRLARLSGKQIQVVETIYLGQRKSLHLVSVEGRRFLLGSTAERITKLASLGDFSGPFDLTGEDCENP